MRLLPVRSNDSALDDMHELFFQCLSKALVGKLHPLREWQIAPPPITPFANVEKCQL